MIIGIPVDKKSMEAKISVHFGRTEFFLLYDTENNSTTFVVNDAMNAQGGAGIKAAQVLVDHNVEALISPRLGQNAFEVISSANMTLYAADGTSINENITALKDGKLASLNDIHKGFHGNGGH